MTNGMETVIKEWSNREGPAVLATVDADQKPNTIYVGDIWLDGRDCFIVADNYFCKTRANIKNGTSAAILFITKDGKSIQVKGSMTYHTDGPAFDIMRLKHSPKHPGLAAAVLHAEESFCGAEKLG